MGKAAHRDFPCGVLGKAAQSGGSDELCLMDQRKGAGRRGWVHCTHPDVLSKATLDAPVGHRALLTSAGVHFSLLAHTGENIQKGSPDFIASVDIWGHNLLQWS